MTDQAAPVRPMTAADYRDGKPVAAAGAPDHGVRDLVLGAVVGAVALWVVPRVLDAVADGGFFGLCDLIGDGEAGGDLDGYELEYEPE